MPVAKLGISFPVELVEEIYREKKSSGKNPKIHKNHKNPQKSRDTSHLNDNTALFYRVAAGLGAGLEV